VQVALERIVSGRLLREEAVGEDGRSGRGEGEGEGVDLGTELDVGIGGGVDVWCCYLEWRDLRYG
jgi:hypothetical protein